MNKRKFRRGEIYYVRPTSANGSVQQGTRPALIVGNDTGNRYCSVHPIVYITSKTKAKLPTHVRIQLEHPSIIMCEHPHSVSDEQIKGYVKTLSEQEMKLVDRALRVALSLSPGRE